MNFIWECICTPFGYLIKWCYDFTGSYAISLFIFALAVKIILFPFGIKQQKNTIKQAKLRPKEQAIRKKYAGRTDQATQQKMQQEIMDFYQTEGYNPAGGCLPLLIQMPVIMALYSVVKSPLTYISRLSAETIQSLKEIVAGINGTAIENAKNIDEITVVSAMTAEKTASQFAEFGDIDIPNMMLFGNIDLAAVPSWEKLLTPLILIPILVLITGYLQQFITQKFSYNPSPEAAKQMRTMSLFMPLMSVWFSFMLPAALGLYWSFQNILAIAQQIILYKVFPVPVISEEEMKAAEKEYKANQKQNVKIASKRRSIVYDDDDDIPETPTPAPKNERRTELTDGEKKDKKQDKTQKIIPQAPLKDDDKNDDK